MECNKEEAIRAKEIAEKKMQNNDFDGARKIALKAQQLFPELENISQLLAVCNVHCSAQNKINGAEKDWYGILQVEKMADEATIKKQFRRFALVLHPDKNQHPGAEAAFKLIGEAYTVLSDKGKRSLHDSKCRVSVRTAASKPPPHQANRNPHVRKQYVAQNNISSGSKTHFNHHQPAQPGLSDGRPVFWTSCPFCYIKYQYYRDLVNRALRCQNCLKPFIAYDLGAQGVPPVSNWGQPGVSMHTPNQGASTVGLQGTAGFPHSHMGSQGSTAGVVGGFKNKEKEDEHVTTKGGKEGVRAPNFVAAKSKESKTSRNTSRKRKMVVESSESGDTSSSADMEDVVIQENGGNPAGHNPEPNDVRQHRRSSRQKQNVSYNENVSDDDFVSPPKRSRGSGSSRNSEEQKEEALDNEASKTENSACSATALGKDKEEIKQKVSATPERSLPNRNVEIDREAAFTVDPDAKKSEIIGDSESISPSTPDPEFFDTPEPEFSDFDEAKEERCFAVDQIWACYDTVDGMPRFYARVRKVFSHEFKLKITWLEVYPEDEREIVWVNEGLPVACGKFVLGNTEDTADRLMFSHQVRYEKGSRRCSYVVHPRKGEIWALFKDWDITWSSDAENHKTYHFEIVEVLSDFNAGVSVAYLDKLAGFVSLFERTTRKGFDSVWIPYSELLRFSHQIPSFRMTGMEREGVPEGSFELDPASLPSNLFELCHSGNVKMETESKDAKVSGSCPKSPEEKEESKMGASRMTTPKKNVDFEGKGDSERELSRLRRSPRELGNIFMKHAK
ncbi:uncharacterized protein LOC132299787 [Cornus florida]|uniref:uncharacterized protein LOC132299787 n=1 Tax=Cornus florida TaxID=4283 RepID=UPI0028978751|nr:uncharacterized protein LOC132299787 [Cornus florida]